MTWTTLLALAVGTYMLKAVGPLGVAGRPLPEPLAGLLRMLPPALLAALVVTQTAAGRGIALDARLIGVVCAGVAAALRAPFAVVIVVGAAVTATLRWAGMP